MSASTTSTVSVNFPEISHGDSFVKLVKTLSNFFLDEVSVPQPLERLKSPAGGQKIQMLIDHLVENVRHKALINALLTLKWHFSLLAAEDHHGVHGIHESRANACEIVAWRFLSRVSERDAVDFCLYTLPIKDLEESNEIQATENDPLLPRFRSKHPSIPRPVSRRADRLLAEVLNAPAPKSTDNDEEEPTSDFCGLNGLEIAAAAGCKNFLSQNAVHKIVCGIWNGDIVFWDSLTPDATKKPHFYIKGRHESFLRLRVPKYIKAFEIIFFSAALFLYYAVIMERNPYQITCLEYALYTWFAAFAYDELGEYLDARGVLYSVNAWNMIDLAIIVLGFFFIIIRSIGISRNDHHIADTAFNMLSLLALLMIPRLASLLSLLPYFGTILPCLKEMTKDFFKFMGIIAVIYIGFLTTFSLLARHSYTVGEMTWFLTQIFLGNNTLGWKIMHNINADLGPPLMIAFVTLNRILLLPALITILHATFTREMTSARLEYLFVYSVYTLEVSTRNRLTHFYPPLNPVPLILVRPFRLCVPTPLLRPYRIFILKITHFPIVCLIWLWDTIRDAVRGAEEVISEIYLSSAEALHISRRSNKKKPFLSTKTTTKGAQHHLIEMPTDNCHLAAPVTHDKKGKHTGDNRGSGGSGESGTGGGNGGLEEQVRILSERVTELTSVVLKGQNQQG